MTSTRLARIEKKISELPREMEAIQNYLKSKQVQDDAHLLKVKSAEKRELDSSNNNATTSSKPPIRTSKKDKPAQRT